MDVPLQRWEGRRAADWAADWGAPRLLLLSTTGSTNTVLRRLGADGAPAGTIVIAEEQTAGRGRLGRVWRAPHGSALLFSTLFRHGRSAAAPGAAPIRAGLAVADAISRASGIEARLKWPNDVLIGGRKVAGILCEAATSSDKTLLVVGIGINVNQLEHDFDAELRADATSLRIACGRTMSRGDLGGHLARELHRIRGRIAEPLADEELARYAARDALLGRAILVDERAAGTASGISPDGALIVDGTAGRTAVVAATVRVMTQPDDSAEADAESPTTRQTRCRC